MALHKQIKQEFADRRAAWWLDGYWLPEEGEDLEIAFNRTKKEVIAVLENQLNDVAQLSFEMFIKLSESARFKGDTRDTRQSSPE